MPAVRRSVTSPVCAFNRFALSSARATVERHESSGRHATCSGNSVPWLRGPDQPVSCDGACGHDVGIGGLGLGLLPAALPGQPDPASAPPQEGDLLAGVSDGTHKLIRPEDIAIGALPVRVWPVSPEGNVVRSENRLNELLLIRLDPATLRLRNPIHFRRRRSCLQRPVSAHRLHDHRLDSIAKSTGLRLPLLRIRSQGSWQGRGWSRGASLASASAQTVERESYGRQTFRCGDPVRWIARAQDG